MRRSDTEAPRVVLAAQTLCRSRLPDACSTFLSPTGVDPIGGGAVARGGGMTRSVYIRTTSLCVVVLFVSASIRPAILCAGLILPH